MEENNTVDNKRDYNAIEDKSLFNIQTIYRVVILNWYWFVLSLIICIGLAKIFLRYTTPMYQIISIFYQQLS